MSSILKAMRKIEQDQRNRQPGLPDLRLDQGRSPSEKTNLRPLISGMLLGAAVVGGILILAFAVARFQQPPETTIVAENREAVSPAIPQDKNTSPVDTQPRTQPQHTAEPVPAPQPTAMPQPRAVPQPTVLPVSPQKLTPSRPAKTVDTVKPAVAEPRPVSRPRPVTEESIAKQQPAPLQAPVGRTLPEGINLVVTQIFPQADPVNSMAVVNDLPVMIGTQIDGAVVKDILPDRVLFQVGDTDYSVEISGSR